MLTLSDLTYRIAGRTLFDDASAVIQKGMKVGFVGRNGTGKTTLYKLITEDIAPESGVITLQKGMRIGQVAQEAPGTAQSLLDFVLSADKERMALLEEAETATDPARIADIQLRLTDIRAHSAEARAGAILNGLGFNAEAQQRACADFSGGWRMRVALAAVLFTEPDLLLLDEPTNYLDIEGTFWLENYLARYPHTAIIISHDRDLLNKAVDTILHLDQTKLTLYRGPYDQFERQRREKLILQQKQNQKLEDKRKHMEAFVERFRAKASKARQAQSRLKALERMGTSTAIIEENTLPLHFPSPEKNNAPPIIALERAAVGYETGKPVLGKLNLRIDPDDRIGLLGANGNGKSTFAKLISGRLPAMDGLMQMSDKLKIAYFAQHQLDELVPGHTAVDHVRVLMPDVPEAKVRARVSQMGLRTEKMDTKAQDLSGGEKARLLLGLATFHGPDLLILDEPTNHLDIDSREALVHALTDYSGAVILISHDRHLLEASADRLWLVKDGTVTTYEGNLDDYNKDIIQTARMQNKGEKPDKDAPKQSKQDTRRAAAAKRAELAPLKKVINTAEKAMEKWQAEIEKLDTRLADPALFTESPEKGAKLSKMRADAEKKLAEAEETWLDASDQYDAGMAALEEG